VPFINVLASSVHNYAALLDVLDCSRHVAKGGKKDARYIANKFRPYMDELDSDKTKIDLVAFDGASSVQKAGDILEVHYPRVTIIHGMEHVVSLFFSDVFKLPQMAVLVIVHRKLRT